MEASWVHCKGIFRKGGDKDAAEEEEEGSGCDGAGRKAPEEEEGSSLDTGN